jgi:tRNA(Ile)-lysidine synthase
MHMKLVKSNQLLQILHSFFEKHFQPGRPLLLGYSGGYDSELLFHLLMQLRKEISFELHLAHVDHGWREESSWQASLLEKKAKSFSCPFHCKRLPQKNSEEEARELRFAFFKTLFATHGFQALLLAHQKNDLAETVFKRFLEGAHLPQLFGMEEISFKENMPIWRPLLSVSRKEILSFVKKEGLSAIEDATNCDPQYLRARMREEMIPYVEKSFGKSILQNLFEASLRSLELKKYLDKKTQKAWESIMQGPYGAVLPLDSFSFLEPLEQSHLLKRLSFVLKIELSRSSIHFLLTWKRKKKNSFRFLTKEAIFSWEKEHLFIQTQPFGMLGKSLPFQEGVYEEGSWRIGIERVEKKEEDQNSWKDAWENRAYLFLPFGEYELTSPNPSSLCVNGRRLKKWWEKAPLLLRKELPVICSQGRVAGDFVSGKSFFPEATGAFWKVSLEFSDKNEKKNG